MLVLKLIEAVDPVAENARVDYLLQSLD